MNALALFGISVAFSFTAWSVVTGQYLWPRLRTLPQRDALRALLSLHAFRFMGLAFLVPGVVGHDLPAAFAKPVAYGDLAAAILALVALAVLATPWGLVVVWLFNVWGTVDLLNAFYQGLFGVHVSPSSFGSAFFIPTVIVPLLLITHGLIFKRLVQPSFVQSRREMNASLDLG
jgi:hypothetical protein